jgi:hypothetical protein
MATSQHEHLFGVNGFFEQMFAFWSHQGYFHANRRSHEGVTRPDSGGTTWPRY